MATANPAAAVRDDPFFHRPILAKALAEQALDTSLGVSGGLFLAAPRRIGKSTFVRQDLIPEFEKRDVAVIYADLWFDKSKDPAELIANAVREALAKEDGPIAKFAKGLGVAKLNVGGFGNGITLDLSQLGLAKDATLADALKALSKAFKKKIVVVVDEAQHALTTDAGMAALFALKAARDSLNIDNTLFGMQLIATGSNRDKLASLVSGREQAFYGADLVDFPTLGKDYITWVIERSRLPLNADRAALVFKGLSNRPESFVNALTSARREFTLDPSADVTELLATHAADLTRIAKQDFLNTLASLPPLQVALLRELAQDASLPVGRPRDGIFSAAMKKRLQERVNGESIDGAPPAVETSTIQNAMDSLREKNFLWRSQRGAYWIEDDQFIDWLKSDGDAAVRG